MAKIRTVRAEWRADNTLWYSAGRYQGERLAASGGLFVCALQADAVEYDETGTVITATMPACTMVSGRKTRFIIERKRG